MSETPVLADVIRLLQNNRCQLQNINEGTMIENLEIDSVMLTSFLIELEEQFNLLVTDEIWSKWKKVGDIVSYVIEFQQEYSTVKLSDIKSDIKEETQGK